MELNLRKTDKTASIEYVGCHLRGADKTKLIGLAAKNGISLSSVVRTAIHNLIDAETK